MTASRYFTRDTKRAAYTRAAGRCECHLCPGLPAYCGGARLYVGRIVYEHINPWAISRDSSLSNAAVLRLECASLKTNEIDLPLIASVQRKGDRHIGAYRPHRPMPCGRRSHLSKPLDGSRPRVRRSLAQKMRATLAARRIGFQEERT